MTYCVGVLPEDGIVLASDSRTHADVDDFASFCKMTVFERPGDRVLVLLSSGSLAGTQAVISLLTQGVAAARDDDGGDAPPSLMGMQTTDPTTTVHQARGRGRGRRAARIVTAALAGSSVAATILRLPLAARPTLHQIFSWA